MTGQTSFIFEQAEAVTPEDSPRVTTPRAAAGFVREQQPPGDAPPPPDYSAFTINPESNYAYDDQHAETLAELCATELKGYLGSVRVLEIALRLGRNPLVRNARPFTEKQTGQLREDIEQARGMAAWMLSECEDAFGEEGAATLQEYARACVDAALGEDVEEETREPEQAGLFG
jgi:hypothetical protein